MFPCGLGPGVDRPGQPMAVIIELFFVMAAKGKVKNLAEFTQGKRIKILLEEGFAVFEYS
jgi:hypothetical protein